MLGLIALIIAGLILYWVAAAIVPVLVAVAGIGGVIYFICSYFSEEEDKRKKKEAYDIAKNDYDTKIRIAKDGICTLLNPGFIIDSKGL